MPAILLNDTDILRLSARVNVQRAAGLIPTGGLLANKGTYFQLMVTGESTVTYTVVMEADDRDFQAKANILSGLGAFALGTPQYINGFWVQAFGDMAGSGGGGTELPDGTVTDQTIQWDGSAWQPGVIPADAVIYGEDDAVGAPLPTIHVTSAQGYPLGLLVIDATGQPNAGIFVQDDATPLMQLTVSTASGLSLAGPAGTGGMSLGPTTTLTGPGNAQVALGSTGASISQSATSGLILEATGDSAANGSLVLRRPYQTSNQGTMTMSNLSVNMRFDTSILAVSSTSATVQAAGASYQFFSASFQPATNNARDIGNTNFRFKDCYLQNAPNVVSDSRAKTAPTAISDAVLDAIGDVDIVQFKLLSAIEAKGEENARYHFGVIAQQLVSAFAARGLDAMDYGLVTHETWDAAPAQVDEEGNVIVAAVEAGDGYGIRYEELLVLEAARVRRELSRLSS